MPEQKDKIVRFMLFTITFVSLALPALAAAEECPTDKRNQIDYAMYFLSDVRDAEQCAQSFVDGEWMTPPGLANPAMTCPDMFSWRLFVDSIRDQFWTRWADERQNWPQAPYPLCIFGGTPEETCCEPGNPNNPKGHCPEFPGDRVERMGADRPELRIGRPSVMHQLNEMVAISSNQPEARLSAQATEDEPLKACTSSILDKLIPEDSESIGRIIRQTNAELTLRNRPFHDYLFENNLYNRDGVREVFVKNNTNLVEQSPYRHASRSANGANREPDLSRIELPPQAIMIKSNWLYEGLASKLGIKEDSTRPFIKKQLATIIQNGDSDEKNGDSDEKCLLEGTHYLVAFHISSKDIPNWVWSTFEHVDLPGRCDITGCNDSYAFRSSDRLPDGTADNYVKPHVRWDALNHGSCVYDRDKVYAPEEIKEPLATLFDQLGIGLRPSTDPKEPTAQDLAWRSYRLKGSQVEFTSSTGRANLLGNSVTEAGFMNGSSCMTCHSRAGIHVDENGRDSTFFKLGVFENSLSDYGYGLSVRGTPNESWFHDSSLPPKLHVLQTDFVWGFFFARPLPRTYE